MKRTLLLTLAHAGALGGALAAQQAGTVLWQFPTGDAVYATPVLDASGNIYFGSMDGTFYSLDPAGTQRWSYASGSGFRGTARLDGLGSVYIPDEGGWLHKLRAGDGAVRWSVRLPGALRSDTRPAISQDGTLVYVGTVENGQEGTFFALSTADGSVVWSDQVWQSPSHIVHDRFEWNDPVVAPGGNVIAIGYDRGTLVSFRGRGGQNWVQEGAFVDGPENLRVDAQGRIFGQSYWALRGYDATGNVLWSRAEFRYNNLDCLAIGPDELLFAGVGATLQALDRRSGSVLWSRSINSAPGPVVYDATRGQAFFLGNGASPTVNAFNRFGTLLWSASSPAVLWRAPSLSDDGAVLYCGGADGSIYAVSTGQAPPELDLRQGLLVRGMPADSIVENARPGESVHFLYSLSGTGPGRCPGQLGGLCLDIVDPVRVLGEAAADGSGRATLRVLVPPSSPLVTVYSQAVARRGPAGSSSVKSNVVSQPIL